jgi:hypothetical protein
MPRKNRVRASKSAKNQSTYYELAETLRRGHVFRNRISERGFDIFSKAKVFFQLSFLKRMLKER